MPGENLETVIDSVIKFSKTFKLANHVTVLSGANDIKPLRNFISSIREPLKKLSPLSHQTNLIINLVPRLDHLVLRKYLVDFVN